MAENKVDLIVVVNGQATEVQGAPNAPLHTIIPRALEQTGNVGQPPDNWELRNVAGALLDVDQKIETYHFDPGTKLFLNLKAGIGGDATLQAADPVVSEVKFDREIAEFQALAGDYRRRGWFMAYSDFPRVLLVATAPQLQPPAVVTGVLFDYSEYDFRPPSVRLVNPFTEVPYQMKELPTALRRATEVDSVLPFGIQLPPGAQLGKIVQQQTLMQAYGPDDVPFLCIAGVREYHDHPGHSGDVWELHRTAGAGRLGRILEVIDTYGVRPLSGYNVNLIPQIAGFAEKDVPS